MTAVSFRGDDHPGGVLAAISKAAVMAHWMPGVGLCLHQPQQPSIRVAAFGDDIDFDGVHLDPCSFRAHVREWIVRDGIGLGHLDQPLGDVTLDLFTDGATELHAAGFAERRLDDDHSVMAFPILSLTNPQAQARRLRTDAQGQPERRPILISVSDDIDLAVSFVHCTFNHRHATERTHVADGLLDVMALCSADEVEGVLAS
ncbi:MAG: hypothetical protein AAGA42_18365 [Actinomycetota bacterium]